MTSASPVPCPAVRRAHAALSVANIARHPVLGRPRSPAEPSISWSNPAMIESISAITLATHDMARAVRFYSVLGFEIVFGGEEAAFTSFRAGRGYLNLIAQPAEDRK